MEKGICWRVELIKGLLAEAETIGGVKIACSWN